MTEANQRIVLFGLLVLFVVGGLFFWGLAATYCFQYFLDTENSIRHEYVAGIFIALAISAPFWFLTSGITVFLKAKQYITGRFLLALNSPSIILLFSFFALNLYVLVETVFG